MEKQISLKIRMELLSDGIFSAGCSIPGGEDIAIYQDEQGYPYLRGTSFKGMLRSALENWVAWSDENENIISALLGEEGWQGTADDHRIHVTALTLENPPADSSDCYDSRTFTKIEKGIVAEGSLREAMCICEGQIFTGTLTCCPQETELVKDVLSCIKWAGASSSRGFGRVKITCEPLKESRNKYAVSECTCLHYRLKTLAPLQLTLLSRSRGNSYETRNYIPGSAIRGLVFSTLAEEQPEWFHQNKTQLLTKVRFWDMLPDPCGQAPLPSIKGFYEEKNGSGFETVVKDGTFTPGMKRAKIGSCCTIKDNKLVYWNAKMDGNTRILRGTNGEDSKPFSSRYLSKGQEFDGYILLEDASLAPKLAEALKPVLWLGADRYEGYGQCEITLLEGVDHPAQFADYGYTHHSPSETLYLLAQSPFTMLDDCGEPCGLNEADLAELLGIEKVTLEFCSTSLSEYGGYNRTWQCREPAVMMYDSGSLFKLHCTPAPSLEKLLALQKKGIGIRTAEGFGQVIALRTELFESISGKEALLETSANIDTDAAKRRRAVCRWLMKEKPEMLKFMNKDSGNAISKSQMGEIQSLCEKSLLLDGDTTQLERYFEKNLEERGPSQKKKFEGIHQYIKNHLDTPVPQLLGIAGEDSICGRLRLLVQLIDHSRKETK